MNRILLENPGFASPQHSTISRVLRDRAIQAARVFQAQVRRFELGLEEPEPEDAYGFLDGAYYTYTTREEQAADEARSERDELRRGLDIQRGCEIMRAAAARRTRPSPARRIRTQPRIRARRSPASTRLATTDSGGTDDGGDPEPPHRPHIYSLGGAL